MALLIRCDACRGMKEIMGMGMIPTKCDTCKGIGYIKEESKIISPVKESQELQGLITELQADIMEDKEEDIHGRKKAKKEKGIS